MDIKRMLANMGQTCAILISKGAKHTTKAKATKAIVETAIDSEQIFHGIPLELLNNLAKEIYHGVKVSIDKCGFLVFHYTSNSGKTTFHPQMWINEMGKLEGNAVHYPGQWWSSADEFIKRANEMFSFTK